MEVVLHTSPINTEAKRKDYTGYNCVRQSILDMPDAATPLCKPQWRDVVEKVTPDLGGDDACPCTKGKTSNLEWFESITAGRDRWCKVLRQS